MDKLKYDGYIHMVDEIKEYFTYVTKAPQSVVDSFFKFVVEKLSVYRTDDLKDLYFNYNQYSNGNTFSSTEFISDVFGKYYLGNGYSLIRVLESIEDKDQRYYEFKVDTIKKNIKQIDDNLVRIKNENKDIEIDDEKYRYNLRREIYCLEMKTTYIDKLEEILAESETNKNK